MSQYRIFNFGKFLADSSHVTSDGMVNSTSTQRYGAFMLFLFFSRDEFPFPLHHINWKGNWERRVEEKGRFPV
jgi:hypothetical protein